MIFPAAFGLAAFLILADGRPPKKGSASAAQEFPLAEPEDYIKTCVVENARGCTQVYLHANGVACKYALVSRTTTMDNRLEPSWTIPKSVTLMLPL